MGYKESPRGAERGFCRPDPRVPKAERNRFSIGGAATRTHQGLDRFSHSSGAGDIHIRLASDIAGCLLRRGRPHGLASGFGPGSGSRAVAVFSHLAFWMESDLAFRRRVAHVLWGGYVRTGKHPGSVSLDRRKLSGNQQDPVFHRRVVDRVLLLRHL